ncbi:hypothetical protein BDW22DRAFT_1341331 [Trametopsis cervina]|nr:hypothetical protein BDW22DRAFT_1341331 [Trametopsis cervina]
MTADECGPAPERAEHAMHCVPAVVAGNVTIQGTSGREGGNATDIVNKRLQTISTAVGLPRVRKALRPASGPGFADAHHSLQLTQPHNRTQPTTAKSPNARSTQTRRAAQLARSNQRRGGTEEHKAERGRERQWKRREAGKRWMPRGTCQSVPMLAWTALGLQLASGGGDQAPELRARRTGSGRRYGLLKQHRRRDGRDMDKKYKNVPTEGRDTNMMPQAQLQWSCVYASQHPARPKTSGGHLRGGPVCRGCSTCVARPRTVRRCKTGAMLASQATRVDRLGSTRRARKEIEDLQD